MSSGSKQLLLPREAYNSNILGNGTSYPGLQGLRPGYDVTASDKSLGTRLLQATKAWVRGYCKRQKPGYEATANDKSLGTRLLQATKACGV